MADVRDAAICARASCLAATFCQRRDAWLQELIRRNSEEIRNAVEVFERDAARVRVEDVADPGFGLATPLREVALALVTGAQQGFDVLLQEQVGLHAAVSC